MDDVLQDSGTHQLILRCCGYLPRNKSWNFPQVFSPFWRLYYNFSSGHHIVYDENIIPLLPSYFVLIPENILFQCVSSRHTSSHLYIHFNLLPGWASLINSPVIIKAAPTATAMAQQLAHAISKLPMAVKTGHLPLSLLHWIFGNLPDNRPIARWPSEALQKALSFIESHLGEDLSNIVLAKTTGVSVRGLIRAFDKEVHLSPQAYVRNIRLREAARQLAYGQATIDHIAETLGFSNRYYFTRQFTKHLGHSPGSFRRQAIKNRVNLR